MEMKISTVKTAELRSTFGGVSFSLGNVQHFTGTNAICNE
jgi:hypothetical protein